MAKPKKKRVTDEIANEIRNGNIDGLFAKIKSLKLQELLSLASQISRERAESEPDPVDRIAGKPRFLKRGWRIRRSSTATRHRLGGTLGPKAPICTACKQSLVLFAQFDFNDTRLSNKRVLGKLPFYYCCSCPGPVHYQIARNGSVHVFPTKRERYEEAPFENPPNALAPAFLELDQLTEEAEKAILSAHRRDGFKLLTKSQRKTIETVLKRQAEGQWDVYFSQIGGYPLSFQDDEGIPSKCPNPTCSSRRAKNGGSSYQRLAVLDVWHDDFWGVKPLDAVQIVFNVCSECRSIAAKYTCT